MNEKQTPKCILEAFENILEEVEDSKLNDEFFTRNEALLQYVGSRLGFTPLQTVIMAILVDKSDERNVSLASLAKYVGCRTTRILRLGEEFEALENRRYIRIVHGKSGKSYRVPQEVLQGRAPYGNKGSKNWILRQPVVDPRVLPKEGACKK